MNDISAIPGRLQDLTLSELTSGEYNSLFPNAISGLSRDLLHAQDYEKFNNAVDSSLNNILSKIQSHPYARRFDCEDRITIDIVNSFQLLGFNAEHEAYHNGNVDITVSHAQSIYWLGEAKIDRNSGYIFEGFRQLVDRYLTENRTKTFPVMLIYCKTRSINKTKENWLSYLKRGDLIKEFSINVTDDGGGKDYLLTSHRCKKTSQTVTVKHHFISLKDCASDKSAKNRKSNNCPNCSKPY
ncbi:hypothetical protein MHM93_10960 [Pseudoalteromonas sp. MM17-2]|uniref:hypothetical protein n=1 Tax=Pseudoalteromonas sp. MM17-2 TaxID=2917753 RepID=UPI001EF488AA|nr:hypothetical protein [Pseudoalteromonas sp. MM17-2]MCG7544700.1 hypothetical protein [Pseudoalteromonas sp. MM17-2]